MAVAQKIHCSHCGAPVDFNPGEIIATCKYCGFTTVLETGKAFTFEHSLLLNKYGQPKPKSFCPQLDELRLPQTPRLSKKIQNNRTNTCLPAFLGGLCTATTKYKGIFERISPAIVKEGEIKKDYNWLVLARAAAGFPTREYDVPLAGKIPYDFRKIEGFAKVLNSEMEREKALGLADQQIEDHHRFLLQQDVDRIIEISTTLDLKQMVYLHAPVWFIKYQYKGNLYQLIIDGATGSVLKGDIPSTKF